MDEGKSELSQAREVDYKEILWRNLKRDTINKNSKVRNACFTVTV